MSNDPEPLVVKGNSHQHGTPLPIALVAASVGGIAGSFIVTLLVVSLLDVLQLGSGFAMIVTAVASFSATGWWFFRWMRPRPIDFGKCQQCGYDLRGLPSNRCPECGMAFR